MRRALRRRVRLIALGSLLGMAARLPAQTLTGRVVLSDSTTPVGGAIVVATTEDGQETRTLTSSSGHFLLRLPRSGPVTTSVLRIGFRPSTGPSVTLAASESRSITLVAQAQPVSLATVTVTGATSCRIRPDSGVAVARIWEEARKAMLAATLRSNAGALTATWMEYERRTDPTSRLVREQSVRVVQHPTQRVFQSLPADSLSRVGYVVQDARGLSYYAPDPDVLLSTAFTDDHCFRLTVAAGDSSTLIGVVFTPARRERGRYDIAGTAWIDRATAELRAVEFRYADLPGVNGPTPAGGRVEFERLASGEWFVSSWYAQLPVFTPAERPGAPGTAGRRVGATRPVLRAVHQSGGDVSRVMRGDTVLFARTLPAVRVQLVASDTVVPAGGARISLQGTNLAVASGSDGVVALGPVPAGEYAALLSHPALDSIDAPPITRTFRARRGDVLDTLVLPSLATVVRDVCPRVDSAAGSALLRGSVRDSTGSLTAGASVSVRYLRVDARTLNSGSIRWNEETRRTTSDARGRWRLCGVPRGTEIVIEAVSDRRETKASLRTRIDPARLAATVDLTLTADTARATPSDDTAAGGLRLLVTTADSTPIPEVTLDLADRRGQHTRTVVTDLLGAATLPVVERGPITIGARRIGFQAGRLSLTLDDSTRDVRIVLSPVAAPTLDTVRISAQRVASRFEGFESRRLNRTATATITRDEIDRRRPVHAWQLLTRLTSVRITASALGVYAASGRGDRPSLIEPGQACPMQIVVDGVRLSPADGSAVDLNQLPPPEAIHGIEVFAGAARVPLEFGGAGANTWCGVIAVWTR